MPLSSDCAGGAIEEECAGQRRDDGRTIRDAVMAREVRVRAVRFDGPHVCRGRAGSGRAGPDRTGRIHGVCVCRSVGRSVGCEPENGVWVCVCVCV